MLRNITKRLISGGTALAMAFLCTFSAFAYRDVKQGSWYEGYIDACTEMGIMNGKLGDLFYPESSLSLVEAVTMAVRAREYYDAHQPEQPEETPEEDPSQTEDGEENTQTTPPADEQQTQPSQPEGEAQEDAAITSNNIEETASATTGGILNDMLTQDDLSDIAQADPSFQQEPSQTQQPSSQPETSQPMTEEDNQTEEEPAPAPQDEPEQDPEDPADPADPEEPADPEDPEDPEIPPEPWYMVYLRRAVELGIITEGELSPADYDKPIARDQMAYLFARALPEEGYPSINTIKSIPDVKETDTYGKEIYTLYRAGILDGRDKYGTFDPDANLTRGEAAAIINRVVDPEKRLTVELQEPPKGLETIVFGKSGEGRNLVAYRIGNGKNVMVINFAIHGYEDHWAGDGVELVYLAEQLKAYLEARLTQVNQKNWTVYIIPCANPDGLYSGWTNNGPGRCTTTRLDANGNLVKGKGIDLNRCFETGFRPITSNARNYVGTQPLMALEARALKQFVISHKGSGKNIAIDTHGWTQQIITGNPYGTLSRTFRKYFPNNAPTYLGRLGYFMDYTRTLGYDSCLFEFPRNVYSHSAFVNSGYITKYINTIWDLIQNY